MLHSVDGKLENFSRKEFGATQHYTATFSYKIYKEKHHVRDVTTGCLERCTAAVEPNQSRCVARGSSQGSRLIFFLGKKYAL